MKKLEISPKYYLIAGVIFAGAAMRLIPHWPNFTPIAAMALVGGTFLKRKDLAFLIPIGSMLLSDLVLGFHSTVLPVYLSFVAIVAMGFVLKNRLNVVNLASASLASSVIFYLVTNFACWTTGVAIYSRDISGLMQSYIAGIPFFFNGILGDLFYNSLFFGSIYLVTSKITSAVK